MIHEFLLENYIKPGHGATYSTVKQIALTAYSSQYIEDMKVLPIDGFIVSSEIISCQSGNLATKDEQNQMKMPWRSSFID